MLSGWYIQFPMILTRSGCEGRSLVYWWPRENSRLFQQSKNVKRNLKISGDAVFLDGGIGITIKPFQEGREPLPLVIAHLKLIRQSKKSIQFVSIFLRGGVWKKAWVILNSTLHVCIVGWNHLDRQLWIEQTVNHFIMMLNLKCDLFWRLHVHLLQSV